jgi:hypothetical protein
MGRDLWLVVYREERGETTESDSLATSCAELEEKECALNQRDVQDRIGKRLTEMRDKYKRGVLIVCRLFSSPESASVCLPKKKKKMAKGASATRVLARRLYLDQYHLLSHVFYTYQSLCLRSRKNHFPPPLWRETHASLCAFLRVGAVKHLKTPHNKHKTPFAFSEFSLRDTIETKWSV